MSPLLVLLVSSVAWTVWVVATVLQKHARGATDGVSIFPVIPLFPLAAWGLAYVFHSHSLPVGATAPGVLHGVLLVVLLASITKSAWKLRRDRKSGTAKPER